MVGEPADVCQIALTPGFIWETTQTPSHEKLASAGWLQRLKEMLDTDAKKVRVKEATRLSPTSSTCY